MSSKKSKSPKSKSPKSKSPKSKSPKSKSLKSKSPKSKSPIKYDLENLPNDILKEILEKLNYEDYAKLCNSSKKIKERCNKLYPDYFSELPLEISSKIFKDVYISDIKSLKRTSKKTYKKAEFSLKKSDKIIFEEFEKLIKTLKTKENDDKILELTLLSNYGKYPHALKIISFNGIYQFEYSNKYLHENKQQFDYVFISTEQIEPKDLSNFLQNGEFELQSENYQSRNLKVIEVLKLFYPFIFEDEYNTKKYHKNYRKVDFNWMEIKDLLDLDYDYDSFRRKLI